MLLKQVYNDRWWWQACYFAGALHVVMRQTGIPKKKKRKIKTGRKRQVKNELKECVAQVPCNAVSQARYTRGNRWGKQKVSCTTRYPAEDFVSIVLLQPHR